MKLAMEWLFAEGHRSAIARGLTSDFAARGIGFALTLWTVGICVRYLGDDYGFWLAGFALVSMLGLLEFGLGPFLVRETASLHGRTSSEEEWSILFSTILAAYIAIAGIVILLGWIIATWIVSFF